MDDQTKVVFVLLAIIVILAGIFVLKVTGIIKPSEKVQTENVLKVEEKTQEKTENKNFNTNKLKGISIFNATTSIFKRLLTIAFTIIINIGIGKLYKKIGLPDWCVVLQYMTPAIEIADLIPYLGPVITFIVGILQLIVIANYFDSVGMSKWWVLAPLTVILIIPFIIAYIIANVRVADKLNKDTVFKVGMAILPFIFQPIIGFMKD